MRLQSFFFRPILGLLAVSLLFSPQPARAGESVLSGDLFLLTMVKALRYDRRIERVADEGKVNIGLIYLKDDQEAKDFVSKINDTFLELGPKIQINNRPLEIKLVALQGNFTKEDLKEELIRGHIAVVVVTMRDSQAAKAIIETTRELGIDSIGNHSDNVRQGTGLGIIDEDDKVRLWVNLDAIKKEGSDYSSRLLALCKVLE